MDNRHFCAKFYLRNEKKRILQHLILPLGLNDGVPSRMPRRLTTRDSPGAWRSSSRSSASVNANANGTVNGAAIGIIAISTAGTRPSLASKVVEGRRRKREALWLM
jgi:hypothetical protein